MNLGQTRTPLAEKHWKSHQNTHHGCYLSFTDKGRKSARVHFFLFIFISLIKYGMSGKDMDGAPLVSTWYQPRSECVRRKRVYVHVHMRWARLARRTGTCGHFCQHVWVSCHNTSPYINCHSPPGKTTESEALSKGMCTSHITSVYVVQTVSHSSTIDW